MRVGHRGRRSHRLSRSKLVPGAGLPVSMTVSWRGSVVRFDRPGGWWTGWLHPAKMDVWFRCLSIEMESIVSCTVIWMGEACPGVPRRGNVISEFSVFREGVH